MGIKLAAASGGSVELVPTNTASNFVATMPAVTGNVVLDSATQTLTAKTLTSPTITGAIVSTMASSVITSGTAVASTSGTSIDFTSIPSWVKRITVMFNGVSTNGTSVKLIQLGDGSINTTGYVSASVALVDGATVNGGSATSGFYIRSVVAADALCGSISICLIGTNSWIASGALSDSARNAAFLTGGAKTLSGTLDRVRITTANGTDTFDAGSINILYE